MTEKGFLPSEAKHVTEKEGEVMNTNIDNYQYRTHSSISIVIHFKFIVKLGWRLVACVVQKWKCTRLQYLRRQYIL
jgi:hypothetical protein